MKTVIITGGAGFIGTNCAEFYLKRNYCVIVFDNFERSGSAHNIEYLKSLKKNLIILKGDITKIYDVNLLKLSILKSDLILHLAGQVAVTKSIGNPRMDFEANALGTLNMLELMRMAKSKAKFIYASTNKVYGGMEDIRIVKEAGRYRYKDYSYGISEERGLDFYSPYGCSKGAGDQYVRDYSRIYGLDTTVLRQSCIYGPRQFGVEDQGWMAWFIIAVSNNKPIQIYGDGCQVRDILYIDDLIDAYDNVYQKRHITRGHVYNIGGGPDNALAVWSQFKTILEKLFRREIPVIYKKWRPGDQKVYISDIRKAKKEIGWKPTTNIVQGINKLYDWIVKNKILFK